MSDTASNQGRGNIMPASHPTTAHVQDDSAAHPHWSGLAGQMEQLAGRVDGRLAVCVCDIASGKELGVRLDEPLPMASTCKVPILVAAYAEAHSGRLDLDERIAFGPSDRCLGSGLLNFFTPGLCPTYRDLLLLMITISDNAATDMVLRRIPPAVVTALMREYGLNCISVDRCIGDLIGDILAAMDPRFARLAFDSWKSLSDTDPELHAIGQDLERNREAVNRAAADRDVASVRDMARLLALIAEDAIVSPAMCAEMRDVLNRQQLNTRLPRDLPPFVRFPHKTGTLGSGAVVNDVGILYIGDVPAASIAVLSRDVRSPIHQTCGVIAAIGRTVYDYYSQKELQQ
jgi:beta-lactamase class A